MNKREIDLINENFPYVRVNQDGSITIAAADVRVFLLEAEIQRLNKEMRLQKSEMDEQRQALHEKLCASLPSWRRGLLSLSTWLWDKSVPQWARV